MGWFGFVLRALKFRKTVTTREKLQHIDEEIDKLDTRLRRNQQLQRSIAVYLITLSILIYIVSLFVFYVWYLPLLWIHRLLYSIPFLIYPLLVFLMKRLLHYVFINRISNNICAVKELKKDKKKILETVMDTETYKVAKELLQKYDPNGSLVEESPIKSVSPKPSEGQELRKRNVQAVGSAIKHTGAPPRTTSNGYPMVPAPQRMPSIVSGSPIMRAPAPMIRGPAPTQRAPVPIAPILPRDRTVFDKFADYFIGDGPNNRYALICKQCYGHNGMVLREEFEFTSYRCCYCSFFNPARKQRLNAPKLHSTQSRTITTTRTESANSTDVESSNKGDDTYDQSDSSVENNSLFEENATKHIEEKIEDNDATGTAGDPHGVQDATGMIQLDTTNHSVNHEISEKVQTIETDKTKEDG